MMRLRKNVREIDDDVTGSADPDDPEWKCRSFSPMRVMGLVVASLMVSSVMFSVSAVLRDFPADGVLTDEDSRLMAVEQLKDAEDGEKNKDVLIGGLLADGLDERSSCASRYQSALLRKSSNFKPSDYLVSRLRRYEHLHQRCGPRTEAYQSALEARSDSAVNLSPMCLGGVSSTFLFLTRPELEQVSLDRRLNAKHASTQSCEAIDGQ